MKILAIADTEERCLWECFRKERFEGVDLILSAGDLDPDYLEFLVTVINKPLIYVRGNHDDRYARHAPGGCICVEDSVYTYRGIRIAGLGGSMRYRDGANMYTEREMSKRMRKLSRKVRMVAGATFCLPMRPPPVWVIWTIYRIEGLSALTRRLSPGEPTTWCMGMYTKATVTIFSVSGSMCVERRSSTPAAIRSLSSTRRATPSVAGRQPGSTRKPCAASSSATRPLSPLPPEHPGNHLKGDAVPFEVVLARDSKKPGPTRGGTGFL